MDALLLHAGHTMPLVTYAGVACTLAGAFAYAWSWWTRRAQEHDDATASPRYAARDEASSDI